VTLVAPTYDHPAPIAERVAAPDLMSDGRAGLNRVGVLDE